MGRPVLAVPDRHCAACNTPLKRLRCIGVLQDRTHFSKRKYCDQKCMAQGMTGVIKVLNEKNSRRQSVRAMKVACENCGATSRLHVHHRDENPLNNEPSNLATLCAPCHMRTHWLIWKATTKQPKPCLHCDKPARSNGLCNTHKTRWRMNGNPLVRKVRIGSRWIPVRGE